MVFNQEDILRKEQLKRLGTHQYKSEGKTYIDPLFQPFWTWTTDKLPLWLAPNLMTIIGLVINIFTTILLVYFSPNGKNEIPAWALILSAIGLFIYQTLDACDGKQARRTGCSSPLGELFDHGCDSLSTVFVSLGSCLATGLGYHPTAMFWQCFVAISLFYCAHWQTYVSGILRFGRFDVTEVQIAVIMMYLTTAIFGINVWKSLIPILNIEMKLFPFYFGCCAACVTFFNQFSVIFTGGIGKNGSSVAGTSVLSPSIPYALVIIPAFIIYQKSTTHLYEDHPALYIMAFGVVAAKVTNRLVVSHMTRSEMDYMDSVLLGPAMLFLNQYFNTFFNETYLLYFCMIYAVYDILHYSAVVCNQICAHLKIQLFRITPRVSSSGQIPMTNSGRPMRRSVARMNNE